MSSIALLVDSHHGVYVPSVFAKHYETDKWGISEADAALLRGPVDACDWYWDVWVSVLDLAEHKDANGRVWKLYQDGDLWAYCPELMTEEEKNAFFGCD